MSGYTTDTRGLGRWFMGCGAAALMLGGGSAWAAEAAAPAGTEVDEVIVTATRRSESAQKVPIAITALSEETIKRDRLANFSDVAAAVTGVSFLQPRGPGFQNVAIRGQTSTNESPGLDLPVAIFQDDIYYGTVGSFQGDFYDTAQIAVLRGPQGTTFGRNVVGGALQITSNKPAMGETSGEIALTAIDRPGFETQGYFNAPLTDNLAGRLAFSVREVDGYYKNLSSGKKLNDRHSWALRGSLRYQPSDTVDIVAAYSHMEETSRGVGYRLYGQGAQVAAQNPDPYTTNLDIDGDSRRKVDSAFVRAEVDTPFGLVTSITGFRALDFSYHEDGDGTALLLNDNYNFAKESQISQEIRLVSETGGKLDYILGVYAEHGNLRRRQVYNFYPNPASQLSVLTGGAFQHQDVVGAFQVDSLAGFGELKYHLTDQIALTAGGRYTYEGKRGSILHDGVSAFYGAAYYVSVEDSWTAFTPRFVLDYQPTSNILLYASASKGFKGGGWPISVTTAAAARVPLTPEKSWSYEIGAKTQWLDRRLTINVDGYVANTKDLQVRSFINGSLRDNNAGEAEVKGVDLEILGKPARGLSLGLRYAYTDAKYASFIGCAAGGVNCTGNELPASPKNDFSFFGEVTLPVGNGDLSLKADIRYADAFQLNPINTQQLVAPQTKIDGLVNASMTYEPHDARWKVQLWVKNLTDIDYVVYAFNYNVFVLTPTEARSVALGGLGYTEADRAVLNAPRSIGVTLTMDF